MKTQEKMLKITPQKPMAGTHEPLLLFLFFFFFFFSLFLGLQHGWIFLFSRSLSPTTALSLTRQPLLTLMVCAHVEGREKGRNGKKLGDGVVRDRKNGE
jgi:hypothetical protein